MDPRLSAATATMISLIGSLADNKSALGRRYGEWAVSAPTIESAVAAAAMAQDELGHARSTYPVLAKLGVQRSDEGLDSGHPLAVIATPLPDWASVIAANLVVDGILTTWVASARATASLGALAHRARKDPAGRGRTSRPCRGRGSSRTGAATGGADRELLLTRIAEMWAQAARWPGPTEHPGFRAAVSEGMVSEGPDQRPRSAVRGGW